MCAIISWAGKLPGGASTLRKIFAASEPQGPHSVGLVTVRDEAIHIFKRAISPREFIRNCNHRIENAAKAGIGCGHVRWATHGNVVDKNAHPFEYGGNWFVHNGIIGNYQALAAHNNMRRIEVDSEALGPLIAQKNLHPAQGSIGLAWVDKTGQLFVYRDSQSLSAYTFFQDGEPTTIVVSRASQLDIATALVDLDFVEHPIHPGIAYKVLPHGLEEEWRDANSRVAKNNYYSPRIVNGSYAGG